MTVYKDTSGLYRWKLRGANGQKVASSGEAFASKSNALRAARRVVALAIGFTASPAFAHHPSISAQSACADGTHVVDIVVAQTAKTTATIDSLTASIDGTSYPVGGYDPIVPPEGMTGATAEIPGQVVGTLVVTAELSWPNLAKTVSTTVELEGPCTVTTTTTAETTTTVPPSTAVVSTVPCDQTPACLPNTGSDPVPLTVVGLGLVGTGALLAAGMRLSRKKA